MVSLAGQEIGVARVAGSVAEYEAVQLLAPEAGSAAALSLTDSLFVDIVCLAVRAESIASRCLSLLSHLGSRVTRESARMANVKGRMFQRRSRRRRIRCWKSYGEEGKIVLMEVKY